MNTKVINLFSNFNFDFNSVLFFLEEIELKSIGYWDNLNYESKYDIEYSDLLFIINSTIHSKNGFTLITKFRKTELNINFFQKKDGILEVRIYLTSLYESERKKLIDKLDVFFSSTRNDLFTIFYGVDDEDEIAENYYEIMNMILKSKIIETSIFFKTNRVVG